MFTGATYKCLPSLSGDLRISNMTTRHTAKTVIKNTTNPAMIRTFSLEIVLAHFIFLLYKDCDYNRRFVAF